MSASPELVEHAPGSGREARLARLAAGRPQCRALDEAPSASWNAPLIAAAGTVCVHGALVLFALFIGLRKSAWSSQPVAVTQMVEVELPPPPKVEEPKPPEREPEPEVKAKPEPAPRVRAPAPAPEASKPPTAEAPPPAAAAAAQVLTQEADVADFGEAIVVGNAAVHAGGVTEAGGSATHAVRDQRARAGGVEGGTGTNLAADRSRQPMLAGGLQWDCPFPEEADEDGVERGDVTLRVEVGADGGVLDVQVKSDPGHGFGREAKRCAMRKRWAAGLDRAGKPTHAVAVVRVKFER